MSSGAKRRRQPSRNPRGGAAEGPGDVSRPGVVPRPSDVDNEESDALRYEAFGRVMAALAAEADAVESCRDLSWWLGADDAWNIEWRDGPYAHELAALLVTRLTESGLDDLSHYPGHHTLEVLGVSVVLHAVDPLGLHRSAARPGLWRLSQALDPLHHTSARRPWEELLGG
ncbi:hypothetical protein Aph01nite_26050 [Acrocarpospora phusangensis]|uniref:Uncharacterized protein n=1 Tax=Acrocarpospora phusangensis TaxID=1070424 RepID=A0A919QCY8_9ACTN|nr:hypothetical protein [Acrocarpospora phusangensis]GIH24295.1 hypothetical protein Aph01nite_26050 [Acrocarpospora phusangensis]